MLQKDAYGIIYKVTCLITNKIYIGQTTTCLGDRKGLHKHRALYQNDYKNHFHNAIRKYGWENFQWEIIDYANSFEQLNEKEIYWINKFNSIENGYNILKGGQNIQANTDKFLRACGSVPFLVYNIKGEFIGEFLNQTQFGKEYGIAPTHVSDMIKDKMNFCNGYIILAKENFSEGKLQKRIQIAQKNNRGKSFIAINIKTKQEFGPFNNQKECINTLKLSSNHIGEVLSGKRKSQEGYYFKYV